MASVARKIFSKLGARPHRTEHCLPDSGTENLLSKVSESCEPGHFQKFQGGFNDHNTADCDHRHPPFAQELPSLSIGPEMAADWSAASHELPDSYISEMQGSECPVELGVGSESWADNFYASTLEEWDVPLQEKSKSSPKLARLDTSFAQINSRSVYESHLSISQETYSPHWSDAPNSATFISPLSAVGGFGISPTDTVDSCNSFFTNDSGYSSATTQSAWSATGTGFGHFDVIKGPRGEKRSRESEVGSENWMSNSSFSRPLELPPVPVFPSQPQTADDVSVAVHSAVKCTGSMKQKVLSPHWSDAGSLVQSFSEVLDAHIAHTKQSLQQQPSSPIKMELLAMSRTSIVSIGLEVLAGVLEGRTPTSIVQIFAFTHVAYAFAIAVDHDDSRVYEEGWFRDSLSWAQGLASERQRQLYLQIARTIWQPIDILSGDAFSTLSSSSEDENALLLASKRFLDSKLDFISLPNTADI